MLRTLVLAVGLLALSAFASAQDKPKTAEEKLTGKWKLTKSDETLPEGLQAEVWFEKDGKLKLKIDFMGKKEESGGTWKLEGEKKIKITFKADQKDKSEVLTIEKLTDEDLVTVDEKSKKDQYKRIVEAKK